MSVGAGICAMSNAVMPLATRGVHCGDRGFGSVPHTRSTTWRRCSGVVPQQPPTTFTPISRTNSSCAAASASGVSGYTARPPSLWGIPAFGMTLMGSGTFSVSQRTGWRMCSGPVEQFSPMTSTPSATRTVAAAAMSVPSSMRPLVSSVTWAWMGTYSRPASARACFSPATWAFTSSMSWLVSIRSTSTPPSSSPRACSANAAISSSYVMAPSDGSLVDGRKPLGPMLPATKRGRSGVAYRSHARRASSAAARFSATTRSCSPYSRMVSRLARNVSVSTASQPTSRKLAWISSITSGRLRTRWSLHPSSASPPKSARVSSRAWMLVPMAPSKTTTRREMASRYGEWLMSYLVRS